MMCDHEIWKSDPKKRGFWNKITSLNMWTWESEGCLHTTVSLYGCHNSSLSCIP
jgi:hypothetical protein